MCKMAKTKIRDSGMPAEAYWESLFDVPLILDRLRVSEYTDVAELGCGYGTFSIPVAEAIAGTLYTFDVDSAMIARTRQRREGRRIVCEDETSVRRLRSQRRCGVAVQHPALRGASKVAAARGRIGA